MINYLIETTNGENVNLTVSRGDVAFVVGGNGSGKS